MLREINVRLLSGEGGTSKLEVIKIVITALASVAIPAVIFFAGQSIEDSAKSRELALKYVEISVGILNESPTPETKNLRDWAIKNINKYAETKLDPEALEELKTEVLPTSAATGQQQQSQNFTIPSEPRKIKYIVVTDAESASLDAENKLMASSNVNASYHYIIGVDGTIEKMVQEENIAWHAGRSEWKGERNLNAVSIGIGLIHLSSKDGKNWMNLPAGHPAVGPKYPPQQIEALVALLAEITQRNRLEADAILTKQEIAPDRRRTDLFGDGIEMIRKRVKSVVSRGG